MIYRNLDSTELFLFIENYAADSAYYIGTYNIKIIF